MGTVFGRESRTEALLQHIATHNQQVNQRLDALLGLNSIVLSSLNVYDAMSMTSAGRVQGLNEDLCTRFSYDPGVCMLTQQTGTCTLAHILPFSSKRSSPVMNLLQLTPDQLDSSENLLLLADNIELAFDSLRVSFVPAIQEGMIERYVLKIWDDSVRDEPLFTHGHARTIGEFENCPLQLHEDHRLFRRCLTFQSFWAAARHLGGHFSANSLPFDMASLDEPHRANFLRLLQVKQTELRHDINAEVV